MHKHHKIPKHAGGTDDPSNIELLSVEEHALAHKKLFEEFGRKEDYLAWKGLEGIISKEEIIRELQRLGGRRAWAKWNSKKIKTSGNWQINKENQEKAEKAAHSAVATHKRKQTFEKIKHQQGETNSTFGTSIYRNSDGERKRFVRSEQPDGWIMSDVWVEDKKNKKNSAYGKRWYNDGIKNFLLFEKDERTKSLKLGRLNPGF